MTDDRGTQERSGNVAPAAEGGREKDQRLEIADSREYSSLIVGCKQICTFRGGFRVCCSVFIISLPLIPCLRFNLIYNEM